MHEVNSTLYRLNKNILQLERVFFLYFVGKEKKAPLKEFEQLKQDVFTLINTKDLPKSTSVQFLVTSFIQRFTIFRSKWERSLRDIEEGRKRPGLEFFGKHKIKEEKPVQVINEEIAKEIEAAATKYVAFFIEYYQKPIDKKTVKRKLQNEIVKLMKNNGTSFTLNVYYDGSDIKIKFIK